MSEQKQTTGGIRRIILAITLIVVSAFVLYSVLPLLMFFGPLVLERTISVSNSPLEEIPERFHPHFSPNAADISGEYSSATRQCEFRYSCTRKDFMALIEREGLSVDGDLTREDSTLETFRQWGPGIAAYEFQAPSKTATVTASAL